MFVVLLCLILLDVGSIGQSASNAGCPVVQDPNQMRVFENKCFQFVLTQTCEFHVAERYCEERGGTLAMPKTKQINDFLVSTLQNSFHYLGHVWIGLDDRQYEYLFRWADGTTLVYTTDFTNWANNNGHLANTLFKHGNEDCVSLEVHTDSWHDFRCHNTLFKDITKPFVCEYKRTQQTTTPKPTTTEKPTPPTTTTTPKPTVPTTTPEPTTTPPATTTTPVPTCPPFLCDLDCGMTGYIIDEETGCTICECDG